MNNIQFIDEVEIREKRILLRVDFNVPLTKELTIAHDVRIRQTLPTIERLIKGNNRLILVSYVGRPKSRDPNLSLTPVVKKLQELIPAKKIILVDDFLSAAGQSQIAAQHSDEIIVLENIRFYPEEKANDPEFGKKLATLADVYVNEAFSVNHREEASIVQVPARLPAYGGLRLKKEIEMLTRVMQGAQKPFVVILGGAKISTKINLINRLMEVADTFLIGGGMGTTFLAAQGQEVGKSLYEQSAIEDAKRLLEMSFTKHTQIVLPVDAIVGRKDDMQSTQVVKKMHEIASEDSILDIGPATEALFGKHIDGANTIIWNGPVGYFENPAFARGTEYVYYAITENTHATSVVGGGDTVAAISKEEYLQKITHISTGGGAMLEYIEKGTLPGIEALKK